jgi:hypothetical protein
VRRAIIILISVMLWSSVFGAPEDDRARVFADSMAQAIAANREASLLENFAPIMRKNYSEAELLGPLKGIRNDFGTISEYEFRNSSVGGRVVALQTIRTATCWYAVATAKIPSGLFMKVEVTYGRSFLPFGVFSHAVCRRRKSSGVAETRAVMLRPVNRVPSA